MDRLEALHMLIRQDPRNRLARYGLAMELAGQGDLEGAVSEFRALIESDPDYAYAYFHCGQMLEKLDRPDQARAAYQEGVAAADRAGDSHARSELQEALDIME